MLAALHLENVMDAIHIVNNANRRAWNILTHGTKVCKAGRERKRALSR